MSDIPDTADTTDAADASDTGAEVSPRPDESSAGRAGLYLELIRWNRPVGWLLLLWPTLVALFLAAEGFPGWHLLLVFIAGTVLMRSAGCAINDYADRDIDRHVQRTRNRPLTTGRIQPAEALAVAAVLALCAFALVLTCNRTTVYWSFAAVAAAAFYPFSKRFLAMPQAVLGVAFSFGIPMAFAAVRGSVPADVWWLVIGNLCWVIAYDTEYALVDMPDDLKLNIRTSAITLGRFAVPVIMLLYLLAFACWLWAWYRFDLLSTPVNRWLAGAGMAGLLAQAVWHGTLIKAADRDRCFRAFRSNHWLGLVWFATTLALLAKTAA